MAHIITNRKSGFIRRNGGMRRQSLWLANLESVTTLAATGAQALVNSLSAAALALRPFTVVRTRGFLISESDQSATSEYFSVAYGDIVVTDQAVSVGISAVPTPALESASDWHVYVRTAGLFDFATGIGFETSGGKFQEFDSKAMRKVDLGEDLIGVLENAGAGLGSITRLFVRTLIKLH